MGLGPGPSGHFALALLMSADSSWFCNGLREATGSLAETVWKGLAPLLAACSPVLIRCVLIHCSKEKLSMKRVWRRKSSLW